jgi:hypothetical protein
MFWPVLYLKMATDFWQNKTTMISGYTAVGLITLDSLVAVISIESKNYEHRFVMYRWSSIL